MPAPSGAEGIVEAVQWLGEPVGSRSALSSYPVYEPCLPGPQCGVFLCVCF